jgi:hypothetical protein
MPESWLGVAVLPGGGPGCALLLPLPVPVVLQFLVDQVLRTGSPGELVHHLPSAIAAALVEGGKAALGAPELLRRIRRGYVARGVPPAPRPPSPGSRWRRCWPPVQMVSPAFAIEPSSSSRSPAAASAAEMASAMIENLQQADATTYLCRLTRSKTDQAGTERKRRP